MITVNGKNHPTITDAAREFGVAAKTVRDWIPRVIPTPPVVQFGIRRVQVFPADYMKIAQRKRAEYIAKKNGSKRKNASLAS